MKINSIESAIVAEIIDQGVEEEILAPGGAMAIVTQTPRGKARTLFPSFQFKSRDPHKLFPVIYRVSPLLQAESDTLGAISWWLTPNDWLGQTPASLLGTDQEEKILNAAKQPKNGNI